MYIINTKLLYGKIESYGLTLNDVAIELESSSSKLSLMLNNKQKNLDLTTLYKLGKLLKLKLNEMIIDDENPLGNDEEEVEYVNDINDSQLLNLSLLSKYFNYELEKIINKKPSIKSMHDAINENNTDLYGKIDRFTFYIQSKLYEDILKNKINNVIEQAKELKASNEENFQIKDLVKMLGTLNDKFLDSVVDEYLKDQEETID